MTNKDHIFVTGATGHIGATLVRGLIKSSVPTTAYVRDEGKARTMFGDELKSGLLTLAIGDFSNVESFKKAIVGHTRIFLLCAVRDMKTMAEIKGSFGKIALDAGVKQIIDLSSQSVEGANSYIGLMHRLAEDRLLSIIGKNHLVILRPCYFFTNTLMHDVATVKSQSKLFGIASPATRFSNVSTDDIAEIALNVFIDPIEMHGTTIYDITSEILSYEERAQIYSRVLGRQISYVQVPVDVIYKQMVEVQHIPHAMAYNLVGFSSDQIKYTPQIAILLKKAPRKFEDYLKEIKNALQ